MADFNSFRNAVFCWLVGLFWRGLFMGKQSLYNLLHYESPIRPVMILMFKYHDESRCELQ